MYLAVEELAREAGEIALAHFGRLAARSVRSKGHLDLVTVADQEVEHHLATRLRALFPEDGIIGEEGSSSSASSGRTWVIDPIDGTFNFVRGREQWAVSIGLYENRRPTFGVVYVPTRKQLFKGGRGHPSTLNGLALPPLKKKIDRSCAVSNIGFSTTIPIEKRLAALKFVMQDAAMTFFHNGSSTISLLELACGRVDGYIGFGEASWDVMGALPILKNIGVRTNLNWPAIKLNDKLDFACGTAQFLEIVAPLMGSLVEKSCEQ